MTKIIWAIKTSNFRTWLSYGLCKMFNKPWEFKE